MTKTKKATRKHIDWQKFFTLVQNGTSHEDIAKKMGIKLDPKSPDPLKPIRALKSRAKTMGARINGEIRKLRVPKHKETPKPKAESKKVKAKPEPTPAAA